VSRGSLLARRVVSVHGKVAEGEQLRRELEQRDARISALRDVVASLEGKNAALQSALINHASEIELLKRKLFGPRSERTGTSELQLTFDALGVDDKELQKQLTALTAPESPSEPLADEPSASSDDGGESSAPPGDKSKDKSKARPKPKGRRDLSVSKLPKVVVEFTDPELAKTGRLIGYDESRQLMREPGGFKVLVKRIAKYEVPAPGGGKTVLGVEAPRTLFPRALLHTSAIAWLAVEKFALGVPHYRLEQHLASEAERLDRSTMCRAMEELGNTVGATIVNAMLVDARANCSVLSTDATGAAIQPGPRDGGPKQVCKKGHFFTIVADTDHVLFEYVEKHTSDAVATLFEGFSGYLQSDASSVYNILEAGRPDPDDLVVTLVGCWAHCRRYFFEAAVCKYPSGVEGLKRIREIYRADKPFGELPPSERQRARLEKVAPLIDDFFDWVARMRREVEGRNLATKAIGYATNQEQELRRVLLDGRLPLDNTRSERALRKIVVGRKNWMFYGSDGHAQAAAAIFSIIASCRLHRIEPRKYLDEILRVLPYWPADRYIELAPSRWKATRATLDPAELDDPLGFLVVAPAL
jgi:transposase